MRSPLSAQSTSLTLAALLLPALWLTAATPAMAQSAKNREEKTQSEPKKEDRRNDDNRSTTVYYPDTTVYTSGPYPYPGPYPGRIPSPSSGFRARGTAPRIAFTSDRDGDPDIYIMLENGADLRRLTKRRGADTDVTFSPWKGRLAYIQAPVGSAAGVVNLMNADAGRPRRIGDAAAQKAMHPAWSPFDDEIAFVSLRDGNPEIYLMNADGRNVRRMTNHPGIDTEPTFSQDGRYIVFVSDRDGTRALYRMSVTGQGAVEKITPDGLGPVSTPTFSPDGKDIAFVVGDESVSDIYTIRADGDKSGQSLHRLTKDASANRSPSFSPTGSQIAFSSNRSGKFSIYVMSADGGKEERVTFGPGNDTAPSWW